MRILKPLFVLFLIFFVSCDKDQDDISLTSAETSALNVIIKEGEWKIDSYVVDGINVSSDFKEFSFSFNEENELSATTSADTYIGSWRASNDSGSETESYNDVDFHIIFIASGKLDALSHNYDVISATSQEVNLSYTESDREVLLSFNRN